ncbi:groeL [Caudoviricetes sp.]|nr:groeL [Caudoviricetes sp.]
MDSIGYSPKDLKFGSDAQQKLANGIRKMAAAVKSTLGPRGNTVLIESPNHTGGITITKDGVTVAKSIDLLDPVENLAVRMMKEAADKTATNAGDGTTTSIVLTEALVVAGIDAFNANPNINKKEILRELKLMAATASNTIQAEAIKVNDETLYDVATISSNNDSYIGGLIAQLYKGLGPNAVVTVERSQTNDTYVEKTEGIKVERGYSSNLFINNHEKDECSYDDVLIMVSDAEISNILQIENVLKPIIQEGKKLLIIAPCSQAMINTVAANVMKNGLKICIIQPPSFGYKQHELMQDIALSVGAKYFSEKTGDDLSLMTYADLGHASRTIVGRDSTIIIKSDTKSNQQNIDERVGQLRAAYDNATRKADKDFILERIASLTGGIGVIYVGGRTDIEQKELYDRVDDAVCAVRSALEMGVVAGGGKTLYNIAKALSDTLHSTARKEAAVAVNIMCSALVAPIMQIMDNGGMWNDEVMNKLNEFNPEIGYDVTTGNVCNLMDSGIIDPAKVTINALENAMSVATTILSTNAIITMARSYEPTN